MSPKRSLGASGRTEVVRPEWFEAFLADRATRNLSKTTMAAYRTDFDAVAAILTGDRGSPLMLPDITTKSVPLAFAIYAENHRPKSVERCRSTWNALCTYLCTAGLIADNPMTLVARPTLAKTLPRALSPTSVTALLSALDANPGRWATWIERDRALILTFLLAGLRTEEVLRANVGDVRAGGDDRVFIVCNTSGKERRVPLNPILVTALRDYLDSRVARFPATAPQHCSPGSGLDAWAPDAPLFVGPDGQRITRPTLLYRVKRALDSAGVSVGHARGPLGLRHTFAAELARAGASAAEVAELLGHESTDTAKRSVVTAKRSIANARRRERRRRTAQ